MRYAICGGGCYGTFYLRQLDRARSRGGLQVDEIIVVDRDADCAAAAMIDTIDGARLEVADWSGWLADADRDRFDDDDQWVPAPIAPHVLFERLGHRLHRALGDAPAAAPWTGTVPDLPFADTIRDGTLVLSHAPGVCPTHCIEPRRCPLTGGDRDWEMRDTVRALIRNADAADDVAVHLCTHHAFGVGTIRFGDVFDEHDRLVAAARAGASRLAVATVSACHGILDLWHTRPLD